MPTRNHSMDDVAQSLAMAVVAASPAPLLLLNGDLAIVAVSKSLCILFGLAPVELLGGPLSAVLGDGPDVSGLGALLAAAVSGQAPTGDCELEIERAGGSVRSLIVQVRRLEYLDLDQTRILVALSDVTDARADRALTQEALRHNSILLQEVRHRVANSLQIVASVLLQNARTTGSDETRGHLKDAHHRVMSVAAFERLLSVSEDGDVDVHAYFTRLCESIAASMIGETDDISLTVTGGEDMVDARVSVSLGLIITELVINALKHAFPNGRPGRITVDYRSHGPNWIMSVRDDGVGMPTGNTPVRLGLGTSIVEALARQLQASVTIIAEQPGAKVSIEHSPIALVQDEPARTLPTPNAITG